MGARPATQNTRPSFPPTVFHRSFMPSSPWRLTPPLSGGHPPSPGSCGGPEVRLPETPAVDLVARTLVDERALLHDHRPVGVGQNVDVLLNHQPGDAAHVA